MTSFKTNRKIHLTSFLIAICIIVLIPSLILLMASSWLGDEYFQAHAFQVGGWQAFWARLSSWSPRPFSDSLLYIYYRVVFWTKEQLSGLFLLIMWSILLGSIFRASQGIITENNEYSRQAKANTIEPSHKLYFKLFLPLLLTLILFIYFIFIEKPSEIFYWPAGAAPYLLSLSGIIINIYYFIHLSESRHISLVDTFKLIIVAMIISFSSESGALYQFLFSSFLLITLFLSRLMQTIHLPLSNLDQSSIKKLFFSLSTSLALSFATLFLLKVARVGKPEMNSLQSAVTGNFKDSLILGAGRFFQETLSLNNISSLLGKICFLLLLFMLFSQARIVLPRAAKIICLITIPVLILTNFIMLFAVYYQFGEVCCERHLHLRSILMGLVLLMIALVLASEQSDNQEQKGILKHPFLKAESTLLALFALTLILLINLQFNKIRDDLYNFRAIADTNRKNWLENINNNNPVGKYTNYKNNYASYVLFFYLKPGIYSSCQANNSSIVQLYMDYFHKKKLYIDSNNSSINFACPPRGNVGYLDTVNGSYNRNVTVAREQSVEITGWAMTPDQTQPANQVFITIGDDNTVVATAQMGQERPDVAKSLGNQALRLSGWRATFTPTNLPNQTITLKAWAYDPTTKTATPLNQTFQVSIK